MYFKGNSSMDIHSFISDFMRFEQVVNKLGVDTIKIPYVMTRLFIAQVLDKTSNDYPGLVKNINDERREFISTDLIYNPNKAMFIVKNLENGCGFVKNTKVDESGVIVDYYHYSKYYKDNVDKFFENLLDVDSAPIPETLGKDKFERIQSLYMVYTSTYKFLSGNLIMDILEEMLLVSCSRILEVILSTNLIGNKKTFYLKMLLNYYLYQIHRHNVDVSFYYLNLYCNCIRLYNFYKDNNNNYVIWNESKGHELKLVMGCKKFVKIIYSLIAYIFTYL